MKKLKLFVFLLLLTSLVTIELSFYGLLSTHNIWYLTSLIFSTFATILLIYCILSSPEGKANNRIYNYYLHIEQMSQPTKLNEKTLFPTTQNRRIF